MALIWTHTKVNWFLLVILPMVRRCWPTFRSQWEWRTSKSFWISCRRGLPTFHLRDVGGIAELVDALLGEQ